MIVAYILLKTNLLKVRPIFKESGAKFKYNGMDYDIDIDCVYNKKFLNLKYFRWIMYYEGVPKPIKITSEGAGISNAVPLNEVAQLMAKLKFLMYEKIFMILLAVNLIIGVGVYFNTAG